MKNLSLVHKLFFLTGWLIFNMLLVGGFSYWNETKLSHSLLDLSLVELPATRLMGTADMMHDGLSGVAYRALFASESNDPAERDALIKQLEEMSSTFHDSVDELEKLSLPLEIKEGISASKPLIEQYIATVSQIVRFSTLGKRSEALALIPTMQDDFEKLEAALGGYSEKIERHAQDAANKAISVSNQATFWGLVIIVLGLVFGAVLSWFLIRGLVKSLRNLMSQLTNESAALRLLSGSIEKVSATLSSSTQREAAAVQQTASSLQETSAMVKKTSDNAEHSHSATEQSAKMAEEGMGQVQQMIQAMERIDTSSELIGREIAESNQQISEIVKLINEIGAKTKVINDIVFQTKLLSFNASVEAARAGEHGKGFAVVAEEVGNLATMSGNAAREINEMLSSSISKVEKIIEDMKSKVERMIDSSRSEVKSGNQIAERCDQTISKVANTVKDVNRRVAEITTAAQEQAAGVLEISKALNELDQVTHTNAQTATQASEMALELTSRSATLLQVVDGLLALVEGEAELKAGSNSKANWADQVAVKIQGFGPEAKDTKPKTEQRLKTISRR